MTRLITGGTGFIGAELARLLVGRGENVVIFDRTIKRGRIDDIEDRVKAVRGDLGDWSEVFNVVKDNKVTHIYHLGAMLNFASEANPWAAFDANVVGTRNVLEAARLFNVEQVMFSSSAATYDLEIGAEITDTTIQRPARFYGISKLFCEGLGRFYRSKFGLDFRSIRYYGVVGPGDSASYHWGPRMIESAVLGEPYECFVSEDSTAPTMLFIKDAARAADMILRVPRENIKMVNYNIKGVANVSARDVAQAIKEYIPGAVIAYKPDPAIMATYKSIFAIRKFDDSRARNEWGWSPSYQTIDQVVAAFIEEMKAHPGRYGLA